LQQRFAIALPHPQKANCLQQRFAIALPHPQKNELLAAALRYRTPTSQTAIPAERNAYALNKHKIIECLI
jgi:hypothetical protein